MCKIDAFSERSPGNGVGTVELVEGGALDAGDGGEGEGQHRHQKKKKQQHFPEKQIINHGELAPALGKVSGLSKLDRCRSSMNGITGFWGHSVRLRRSYS